MAFILKDRWRLMLGLAAVPSTLQMIAIIFMPESPRWLSKVNLHEEAYKALSIIYKTEFLPAKILNL
jgi:hypothetical protein